MKIMAFDPFLSKDKAKSLKVELVKLDTLLQNADFITIHTPLTEKTRHLIDEKAFKKMKKGVQIINAARGGIIDEKAMAKYLKSGKVSGAALDVYETNAKPPLDSPVFNLDNVIATPHLGSATKEAQLNVAVDVAQSVADALTGKGYRNAANVPVVGEEMLVMAQPYIDLAEKLGRIQSQLMKGPIKSVMVKYSGDAADIDSAVMTRALLKGILDPMLEEQINYVNSLVIAKERGINVIEKRTSEITDFATLICVELDTGTNKHLIMGTLFGNKEPRVVMLDNVYVEAIPEGCLLVISNEDVPGIVGKVGTIIGKAGINIAGINLGRDLKTKQAISILNLDSQLDVKVIRKLNAIGRA